jgi:predicted component of type VI protein secretion system
MAVRELVQAGMIHQAVVDHFNEEWVVYISFSSAYTVLLASNSTVSFY